MADTGYGTHTRNLVSRMAGDFDPFIHAVGGWEGMGIDWQGVQVFPSGAGKFGEQSIPYWYQENDADVVFSHHDHWSFPQTLKNIQERGIPTVLYTILDHDLPGKTPPQAVIEANEEAYKTIVMSEWALERMRNTRIPNEQIHQIPHGVNTAKFAPVTHRIDQGELKLDLGVEEDAFVFGMVAANYGPRKNIPLHMEAFRRFRERNDADDAYLYVHTHPQMSGGYDLHQVRRDLGLENLVLFPDSHKVYHGIDDLTIVQLLNTFDVHLNVTQSESWGLTITEAMACGTPVIGANNSAQTEQFDVGHDFHVSTDEQFTTTPNGLLVNRGNEMWTQNASARRFTASVDDMVAAMEYAYEHPEQMELMGANARDFVCEHYDYDHLYETEWKPLFEEVEDDLLGEEYDEFYFKRREAETQSQPFSNEVQDLAMNIRGETVIDVGAGTGTLAEKLEDGFGFDVTAVEYAEAGIEYIEEKGIEAYQGDIRDLQFKDDAFDTAISQHVLEHIDADAAALAELARVARKRVLCIVPGKNSLGDGVDPTEERRYDERELDRLAEDFEKLTGNGMNYTELQVSPDAVNYRITVECGDLDGADT